MCPGKLFPKEIFLNYYSDKQELVILGRIYLVEKANRGIFLQVQIVTDSSCDLPKELINKYNIQVVPLSIHFNDDIFIDQVEIDNDTFMQSWRRGDLPKTSRPNPMAFVEAFQKAGQGTGPLYYFILGFKRHLRVQLLPRDGLTVALRLLIFNASIGIGLQVIKLVSWHSRV